MRERAPDQLRTIKLEADPLEYPLGSVLIRWGRNQLLCTVSVEEKLPPWKMGSDSGWLTAEYAMLPAATHTRNERERNRSKPDGRSQEIGRLIGRALRAAVDLRRLGPRTIQVDCEVLQADGGTRCAAVTGAVAALALAFHRLRERGLLTEDPLRQRVVAVSAGVVEGQPVLDLDYADDHRAQVDMNFVLTEAGELVEVQGTAEGKPFTFGQLQQLWELARGALPRLLALQSQVLPAAPRASNSVTRPRSTPVPVRAGLGLRRILLATSNPGKVREFCDLLAPLGLIVEGLPDHPEVCLPEECGSTFEENATDKALAAARQSGMLTVADDSGLCVDALGGAPGVHSARFGGPGATDHDRCLRLLEALRGVDAAQRTATFHCVIAVAAPTGEPVCVRGQTRGVILTELQGTGGFGYDPLFFVPELGRTYAQLERTEKDRVSHRGRAAAQLPAVLEKLTRNN